MRTYMANKDGRPILTQLNNGILNSKNAMPLKDLTSDNDASFELSRKIFNKAYIPKTNFQTAAVGRSFFQRRAPGIEHGYIVDGPKSVQQKKWIGGNRDASNVAERRRKATTGAIMSYSGPTSFVSVNDNNPRIDALSRVRGGGACVPPKCQNRPVTFTNGPLIIQYYRIISAGMNAVTEGGIVTYAGSTAYNMSPGIYNYTNMSPVQKPLYNVTPLATFGRSYNVFTIDKATGTTTFINFDVFLTPQYINNEGLMTTYLNSLPNTVFVIIATYDEPSTVENVALNANFINAVKNCGASSQFASATFYYRSAYILIGTPGIGTGKGFEKYMGVNNGGTGDPQAVIDLNVYFANGAVTYVSG